LHQGDQELLRKCPKIEHDLILTRKLANFGQVEYEAPAKTSCRIIMIVVILITEGFRQAGELENLRVSFGNEKEKWLFKTCPSALL